MNRKVALGAGAGLLVVLGGIWMARQQPENPLRAARLSVKNAVDPDAKNISLTAQPTSIRDILNSAVPSKLGERVGPFESTVWEIKAKVETIELKKDGDYYMVVSDSQGDRTVVEVPDPEKCKGSPLYDQIASTRKQLESKYHPTSEKKEVNEEATIQGVGFLGFGSGRKSSGATGFSSPRLMPGTSVNFGS